MALPALAERLGVTATCVGTVACTDVSGQVMGDITEAIVKAVDDLAGKPKDLESSVRVGRRRGEA